MADKVVLDIEVGGVDGFDKSIKSVKDLKTALKAAKDAQVEAAAKFGETSKEFINASKNVSTLKDKVDDLNDSTNSLKGSGLERARQGFQQFGEGLRNLDFDKVKVGLTAMKSALAAVGIGLIVQAVVYLVENFESLSQGSGALAKSLRFVGDIITAITDAAYKLTDALGLTNSELDKQGETIKDNADKAKEALAGQTAEYDRQIAIAKASGKSAIDLEIAKQQAIIETNKALVEQTIAYVRNGGALNEEQKKLLTEQLEAIKGAVNQQNVIEITHTTEITNEYKKRRDEHKKHLDDLQAQEADAWFAAQVEDEKRKEKEKQDEINAEIAEQDRLAKIGADQDAQMARFTKSKNDEVEATKAAEEEKRAAQQETISQYTAATQQGLAAAQQITDIFFAYKLRKAHGDVAAENAIKKKQFQVNKAFGITNAVIDGIGAVQKALNNPYPLNIVLAAISGIAAAANIAKIASTKFEPSAGGGGGGDAPTSIPVPAPPTISTPQANVSGTNFDENGKKISQGGQVPVINVTSSVGVDEIADKTKRVQTLEKQATF